MMVLVVCRGFCEPIDVVMMVSRGSLEKWVAPTCCCSSSWAAVAG